VPRSYLCISVRPRRLHAVAILRFGKVDTLFRLLPFCQRAVRNQLMRGRLSASVAAALVTALGDDGFAFVTGASDNLRDVPTAAIEVSP